MPIEKLQRVRVATVAILALVLSAGFLLGVVWDQRLDAQPGSATEGSAVSTWTRARGGRQSAIYVRVLPTLSAEQLAAAEVIIARRREAAQVLMKEARVDSLYTVMKSAERAFKDVYNPRFTALMEGSRDAIKLVMTPAQVAYYDSLLADNDRRRSSETGTGPR